MTFATRRFPAIAETAIPMRIAGHEGNRWANRRHPYEGRDPVGDEPRHLKGQEADAESQRPGGDGIGTVWPCHQLWNSSKNGGNVMIAPAMPSPNPT